MDALLIEGPAKLSGRVTVSGSKNTALPLIFSSLLFEGEISFQNVPRLWDIETTLQLLSSMGTEYSWNKDNGIIHLLPRVKNPVAPYEWVKKMRAGILALGPLVARYGEAKVSLPGGCAIGARPVNYHIEALRQLGVTIEVQEGYILAKTKGALRGTKIHFPQVTVTGTENLLIVAATAEGETILENAACEPEVVSLGNFLISCGAKIRGLGTSTVRIQGSPLTQPKAPVVIPPDRIETGTWIAVSVATKSPLTLEACDPLQMTSVIAAYRSMGVGIDDSTPGVMKISPPETLQAIDVETQPYPGFPTDMQAQMITSMCLAQGKSHMIEHIFENRFMHVAELIRLGAKIDVQGSRATVEGPVSLIGAPLMATDLRASASLVVAGLAARGTTRVSRIYHLDRGYQRLDEKLRQLGARISRVTE
jgi:UDP-N-acetylglucosamine 1-carboxyvinyltransferase